MIYTECPNCGTEIIEPSDCRTCEGMKMITPPTLCYYNCEGGGDCSKDIKGWKPEDCKTCGKIPCPDCNGTGKSGDYYCPHCNWSHEE